LPPRLLAARLQPFEGPAAVLGGRDAGPPLQEATDLVAHDGPQPAAEAAQVRPVLERPDRLADAGEHLLSDVLGVLVPQPPAAAVAVRQRAVDIDEALPRLQVVRVTQAQQQTRSRVPLGGLVRHDLLPCAGRNLAPFSLAGPAEKGLCSRAGVRSQ